MDRSKMRRIIGAIVSLLVALEVIGETQGVGLSQLFCAVAECV